MPVPHGVAFEHPSASSSKPHYLSYATARTVADDDLFGLWNGPTSASRVVRINKDGQVQAANGLVTLPTYSFESDKDCGLYRIGANNVGVAVNGAKVLDVGTGGLGVTGTLNVSGAVTLDGAVTIGNATGDALTYHPSAWTLTNAVTITGTWTNLGAVTTVDINGGTVGGVTLDGTISGTPTWASSQAITLSTAAQASVTSLGTLTSLTVSGLLTASAGLTLTGNLIQATAVSQVIPGVTSWGVRNNANNANNLILTDAGAATFRSTVDGITTLTATTVVGNLTGNASGTALTVTQAAQAAITSVGTLTTLTVDDITINGNTISSAGASTLAITPTAGQAITFDGTVTLDAGVIAGATSITSTTFVGNLTGNASGSALTVTQAAQAAITSLGTLTALTVSGTAYIGDTSNANVTLGLTINQGANDNFIFDLKSSDVAHGLTSYAETDSYFVMLKQSATLGGVQMYALGEDAALSTVLHIQSLGGTADATKSTAGRALVEVYASEHNGASALADITADGNVFGVRARRGGADVALMLLDEDGDLWLGGTLTAVGTIYIGDTSNANVTLGLTINQGAADNRILSLKSSDVATGLTTSVNQISCETDDFFGLMKASATLGGTRVHSMAADAALTAALVFESYGGTADATKSTAGRALIEMYASEHNGANALADITADGNVFGVRARRGGADVALFLVDEDGDFHYDGTGTAYDAEDDAALVRAFSLATSKNVIRSEFDDFVKYNEADLVRLGLLGDTVENGGLVNGAQLQRLLVGAAWQQACRITALEDQLKMLTA